VGIENYIKIFNDRWAGKIFNNTLFYVFTTLCFFNVGMALFVSIVTTHINEGVGSAIRAIWLLPRITPSTVYALLWLWAARGEENSLFNWILGFLGFKPIDWRLSHPWLLVILVNGFIGTSFGMIIFTAALKSIPEDYIRAAKVDGASTLQTIIHVELPMIKWPLLFVTAYQTLSLLTSYEYILLVTDGGPGLFTTEVWALYSYHLAFTQYGGIVKFGYGAALATILVIIGIIMSVIYWKVFKFKELMLEPKIEV
jgi:inositol-phosphate transport system permease protein